MKNLNLCLLLVFFFCNVSFSQSDSTGTVTDIDGNVYQTVKIGDQWWMAENLKVTHYQNGDFIPNVTDDNQWINLTTGAYCNYDNDSTNVATYGRLYNWYAVADSHNIAPAGWHVPSDAEWQTLVDYLGGDTVAGGKLKESGTTHWSSPNTGATNESGFCALPGGYRYYYNGAFNYVGGSAIFWSSTESDISFAWYRGLYYCNTDVNRSDCNKQYGFSVRCVRDSAATMIKSSKVQPINSPRLTQNYPNPFNPTTTISFDLPKTSEVTLKIFNILGEEVTTLVSDRLSAGLYSYEWVASNLASGVYLYRLTAGNYVEMRKMVLMR